MTQTVFQSGRCAPFHQHFVVACHGIEVSLLFINKLTILTEHALITYSLTHLTLREINPKSIVTYIYNL